MAQEQHEEAYEIGGRRLYRAYTLGGFPVTAAESKRLRARLDGSRYVRKEPEEEQLQGWLPGEKPVEEFVGETAHWCVPNPAQRVVDRLEPREETREEVAGGSCQRRRVRLPYIV